MSVYSEISLNGSLGKNKRKKYRVKHILYHTPETGNNERMTTGPSSTLKQGQGILPTGLRSMISSMHPPQCKVPLCPTI